ncbi:MAG: hypothetical protein KAR40_07820 [Candidatus Sabulitectum sp.]|nr:hypothetical protein [Candidatus Sabulitectum sp.]
MPQILFKDGAAVNGYTSSRCSFYNPTPTQGTFVIDGVHRSMSVEELQFPINARIAVPAVISIQAEFSGDATGGTAIYAITAESDPGASELRIWSAIIEDHDIGTSGYGNYSGMELMSKGFSMRNIRNTNQFQRPVPRDCLFNKNL